MKSAQLLAVTLILFFQAVTLAAECWTQEVNPKTRNPYSSKAEYDNHLRIWTDRAKPLPNPLNLVRAYQIYKNEQVNAARMKNDKIKHCYVGCRISQSTTVRTAEYVGWYKEIQDLTDCRRATHFENIDYLATAHGAQVAQSGASPAICVNACHRAWLNY